MSYSAWAVRSLYRFHLRVGARVALREAAPKLGLPIVALGFLGPGPALYLLQAVFVFGGPLFTAVVFLAVSVVAHRTTLPLVLGSTSGWLRHLPAAGEDHRRAAMLALALAQSPLLVPLAASGLAVQGSAGLLRLAVSVPLAFVAALLVLPVQHRWRSRPPALLAVLLLGAGGPLSVAGGVLLGLLAGRLAGTLASPCRMPTARRWRRSVSRNFRIEERIAWRAIAGRILEAWAVGLLPLLLVHVFARNNGLSTSQLPGAFSGAGLFGAGLVVAHVGERLARRRPPWPWARSLPGSCRARLLADSAFLLVLALPPVIVGGLLLPSRLAPVALSLPLLALHAAGCMRRPPEARTGPATAIVAMGLVVAVGVGITPWSGVGMAVAAVGALRWAEARERRDKASAWLELRGSLAGDPLSYGGGG